MKKINPKYYINSSKLNSAFYYVNKAIEYLNYANIELEIFGDNIKELNDIKKNIILLSENIKNKTMELEKE